MQSLTGSFTKLTMDLSTPTWDRTAMSTLKGRLRTIKESAYLSDCTIVLSSDNDEDAHEKFYNAHRIFLESVSPVFQQMFRDAEFEISRKSTVRVSNIAPNIMDKILTYVYLDEVELHDLDEALELLRSAITYSIYGLIKFLSPRIINEIRPDNALKIYKFAFEGRESIHEILEAAMRIICRDADVLVETMEFLELPETCLMEIIRRDDLAVSSELKLYQAVKRWGEVKCESEGINPQKDDNLRKVLQPLVGQIRFPLMDQEEFTLHVGVNNTILNMEDMVAILLYFTVPKEKRGAIPPGRFKSIPRAYREQTTPTEVSQHKVTNKNSESFNVFSSAYSRNETPVVASNSNTTAPFLHNIYEVMGSSRNVHQDSNQAVYGEDEFPEQQIVISSSVDSVMGALTGARKYKQK